MRNEEGMHESSMDVDKQPYTQMLRSLLADHHKGCGIAYVDSVWHATIGVCRYCFITIAQ